ncbi:putative F-box protein At5g55150 isoform X3 [Macadamia integrifolia]|uniref:putative F-box protein At5g55150 isoform X3 n=1 Tax=Macadamia integrifolia TaxID=60698 RepID=UPI001C4FEF1C|nr:putative F-box protein At5g55150 isoform X3 [Macadamia integrifolia]
MKKGDEATWSELPEEFLEIIARRLTCLFDYVQFGAVCQSWHSTMVNMHQHLTFWDPWLMLPEKEDKSMIRSFYILSKRNIFELKLPEAHAKRCIGSSKGWLVMVDVSLSIQLLNPYTRVQVQLPHQMTFQDQNNFAQGYTSEELRDFFILKVVLSSSPSNPDYISIAIYSDWGKLAIARSGDEVWTTIPSEWFAFTDVIYYKEQFYAINWNGEVVSCDVGAHPKTTLITTPARESYGQKYLVECSATGVKRDCIYFTDDYLKAHQGHHNEWAGSDMGVFHLEDGRIEPHYSGYACHPFSLPIWYTPNKG